MTTLTIDIHNKEEEKALLDFLNKSNFTYRTNEDFDLSEEKEREILRREKAFEDGKIKSQPWDEVRKRFMRT